MTDIQQAAEYQAAQHRERKPLDLMLQPFAPQTMAEAYAVQAGMVSMLAETRGPAAGYKIAYTSAVMRERTGVGQPCYGRIPASMVYSSPATVDSSDYGAVGIECEVAVETGRGCASIGRAVHAGEHRGIYRVAGGFVRVGGQEGCAIAGWADAGDLQHRDEHQQRGRGAW